MKKLLSMMVSAVLLAGISAGAAQAKRLHKPKAMSSATTGSARSMPGNNAELGGNNGNSASGSNTISRNLGNTR